MSHTDVGDTSSQWGVRLSRGDIDKYVRTELLRITRAVKLTR